MRPDGYLWLIILLLASSLAGASVDVPLWLNEAARLTLPDYPAETNAVVLLDHQDTVVNNTGVIFTTHRRAVKVLREAGCEEAARLVVGSAYDTKIRSMTGWNITPIRKVTMKQTLESGLAPDTLYTDAKITILAVPDVKVGSVVGFEWQEERTPPSLEDIFEFQGRFPVLSARYSISLPAGWNMDIYWINWKSSEAQTAPTSSTRRTWEMQDIPAIVDEPRMPKDRALAGRLIVRPKTPQPDSRCFSGWAEMGVWYDKLTRDCRLLGITISDKVGRLTAGIPDTLSKLRALADFVQKEIRYVSIQIGIGGFKPHSAGGILFNRYGDCKDKATLLSSMLQVLGIASHYVIVNTDRGTVTAESPVSLYSFNHAVLAIRLPDEVPDTSLMAIVHHPKLGRLLIFDPTTPYTPLGHLPIYLQGNTALLVAEGNSELISLPLPEPENNLLERRGRFTLQADGTLQGEIEEKRSGYLADQLRYSMLNMTASERTRFMETFLSYFFPSFALQTSEFKKLEENYADLVVSYRFSVPKYAKAARGLLIVRPCVVGNKSEKLETSENKPRCYPIDLETTSLQHDEFIIELPEGCGVEELPPAADLNPGFATYKSKTEVSGHTIVYQREYRLQRPLLPAAWFDEAVKFFRAIDSDEHQSALLKK